MRLGQCERRIWIFEYVIKFLTLYLSLCAFYCVKGLGLCRGAVVRLLIMEGADTRDMDEIRNLKGHTHSKDAIAALWPSCFRLLMMYDAPARHVLCG